MRRKHRNETIQVECLQIGIVASIARHNWILQFHRTVNGTTLIAIMFQVNMFLSPFILILFKALFALIFSHRMLNRSCSTFMCRNKILLLFVLSYLSGTIPLPSTELLKKANTMRAFGLNGWCAIDGWREQSISYGKKKVSNK